MQKRLPRSAALTVRGDARLAATAGGKMTPRKVRTIARVAVQLAREDAGLYMTCQEIARHASELVDAAYAARDALTKGRSPNAHFKAVARVAGLFGARTVDQRDAAGMVCGLEFCSGRFTSGAGNVFYVA